MKQVGGTIELFTSIHKEAVNALKKRTKFEASKSIEEKKLKISKNADSEVQAVRASLNTIKKKEKQQQAAIEEAQKALELGEARRKMQLELSK